MKAINQIFLLGVLLAAAAGAAEISEIRYKSGTEFTCPGVRHELKKSQNANVELHGNKVKFERITLPGGAWTLHTFTLKTPPLPTSGAAYSFLVRTNGDNLIVQFGAGMLGIKDNGFALSLRDHPKEHIYRIHAGSIYLAPDGKTYKQFYRLADKKGCEVARKTWCHIMAVNNRNTVDFYRNGDLIYSYDVSEYRTWSMLTGTQFRLSFKNARADSEPVVADFAEAAVFLALPGVEEIKDEAQAALDTAAALGSDF